MQPRSQVDISHLVMQPESQDLALVRLGRSNGIPIKWDQHMYIM